MKMIKKEQDKIRHFDLFNHQKYHLVLVTKNRHQCLTENVLQRLEEICRKWCILWNAELCQFEGGDYYIHILFNMGPEIMPSRFVRGFKIISCRVLHKQFSKQLKKFYNKSELWSRGYCLVTANSEPKSVLKKYLEQVSITEE